MILKCGSIVSSLSGSLGGHSSGLNRGRQVLMNKPYHKIKSNSSSQSFINDVAILKKNWKSFTVAQRAAWNTSAQSGYFSPNFANNVSHSGFTLYLHINQYYPIYHYSILSLPPVNIGANFIKNFTATCQTVTKALYITDNGYAQTNKYCIISVTHTPAFINQPPDRAFVRCDFMWVAGTAAQYITASFNKVMFQFPKLSDTVWIKIEIFDIRSRLSQSPVYLKASMLNI